MREAIGDVHATVALLQESIAAALPPLGHTLTRRRSSASGRGRRRSCTNSLPSTAPPSSRTARHSEPSIAPSVPNTTIYTLGSSARCARCCRKFSALTASLSARRPSTPPPAALGVAAAAATESSVASGSLPSTARSTPAARHASRRPRRWRRASCRRLGCRTRRRRRLANESTSRPNRSGVAARTRGATRRPWAPSTTTLRRRWAAGSARPLAARGATKRARRRSAAGARIVRRSPFSSVGAAGAVVRTRRRCPRYVNSQPSRPRWKRPNASSAPSTCSRSRRRGACRRRRRRRGSATAPPIPRAMRAPTPTRAVSAISSLR